MMDFLEAVSGGAIWGIGFGVAVVAVEAVVGSARPVAEGGARGLAGLGDWVRNATASGQGAVRDLYTEARAELDAERSPRTLSPEQPA